MSSDPSSDETLLAQAAQRDPAAAQELLARYRSRLRQMVAIRLDSRLGGRLDPSDVVQETMLIASQPLTEYLRTRPMEFYPWLRQIAWDRLVEAHRRHVQAQRRSLKREQRIGPILSDQSMADFVAKICPRSPSPSQHWQREELRARIRHELHALPPRDRETLILLYLEQLRPREAGEVLGISEKSVNMRHLRALTRLRARLATLFSGDET